MLDVAVYANHSFRSADPPLYAGRHRIPTGAREVTFEVRGRPVFISVDAVSAAWRWSAPTRCGR
jgi:hypothetical protein